MFCDTKFISFFYSFYVNIKKFWNLKQLDVDDNCLFSEYSTHENTNLQNYRKIEEESVDCLFIFVYFVIFVTIIA